MFFFSHRGTPRCSDVSMCEYWRLWSIHVWVVIWTSNFGHRIWHYVFISISHLVFILHISKNKGDAIHFDVQESFLPVFWVTIYILYVDVRGVILVSILGVQLMKLFHILILLQGLDVSMLWFNMGSWESIISFVLSLWLSAFWICLTFSENFIFFVGELENTW